MSHCRTTLNIRQLFDYETWTYTYLLWDDVTKEAAIIDTVREQYDRDLQLIQQLGLTLKYTLDTHIHADHITANGLLRDATGCEIIIHKNAAISCADHLVDDGQKLYLGEHAIEVMYTPGHTNMDICFKIDHAVFTGDTLLVRDCGRTDFQLGDTEAMYHSLHRLFTLPDETMVYPGHDYKGFSCSTIGEEKRFNTRAGNGKSFAEFKQIMDALNLPKPKRIDIAVPGNLVCGKMGYE
jgi:glyoxylase-like metal-dependent hydrolase (beta-lactamase superfamily II)